MEINHEALNTVFKAEKKYKCPFEGCRLEFLKPSSLKWHTNVHLEEKPFQCNFEGCNKSYSNPSHLKRHIEQTHGGKKQRALCEFCQKYFSNSNNLKRHIKRSHSNDSKFCTQCNKRFKLEITYEEHMVLFHQSQGNKLQLYECEQCGTTLSSYRNFRRHKKNHLSKTILCDFISCSAIFNSIHSLKEHQKSVHSTTYICAECNKEFNSKGIIRNHILSKHLGVKITASSEFTCPYAECSRVYAFKKNLRQHIRIYHKGIRFKCDVCDNELSSKQKLQQHKIKKHTRKKYSIIRTNQILD
ncbi:oocyte zinc finger protein XlCOF26-like [Copidosoma floridanum]|uniref:oocyte zinc finger protein XlCOF26-like n=1 Tax=Copidosoma floridanum TaxID=29053 RepID=UPI0006C99F4E|nr:oocyte zinc finger protein XlCOF26-like [Copidosoma floridanum]